MSKKKNLIDNKCPVVDLFRFELRGVVSVSQPAVVTQPPGVEISVRDDGSTVRAATRNVSHTFGLQGFH